MCDRCTVAQCVVCRAAHCVWCTLCSVQCVAVQAQSVQCTLCKGGDCALYETRDVQCAISIPTSSPNRHPILSLYYGHVASNTPGSTILFMILTTRFGRACIMNIFVVDCCRQKLSGPSLAKHSGFGEYVWLQAWEGGVRVTGPPRPRSRKQDTTHVIFVPSPGGASWPRARFHRNRQLPGD